MSTPTELTVIRLEVDTIDVTPFAGPPTVMPGGWVQVTATNGAMTIDRRMSLATEPRIGETITVTIDDEETA